MPTYKPTTTNTRHNLIRDSLLASETSAGHVPGCREACSYVPSKPRSPRETTDNRRKRLLRTDLALNPTSLDTALQIRRGYRARLGSYLLEEVIRTPSFLRPKEVALLLGPGGGGTVTLSWWESPDGCRQPGCVAASSRVW